MEYTKRRLNDSGQVARQRTRVGRSTSTRRLAWASLSFKSVDIHLNECLNVLSSITAMIVCMFEHVQ
jgi:hypothetical protein